MGIDPVPSKLCRWGLSDAGTAVCRTRAGEVPTLGVLYFTKGVNTYVILLFGLSPVPTPGKGGADFALPSWFS